MGGIRYIFSSLQIALVTEKKYPHGTEPGFQGEYFFTAGEWTHIAYTWDIKEGENGTEGTFAIFVNGKKLPYYRDVYYGVSLLTGTERIKLLDEKTDIVLGPFEGSMDILRVSDIIRYKDDFTPSKIDPVMDKNTRALFLFDGTLIGNSYFSNREIELR